MVWRSRVIFTRSSRAASSCGSGARTCTAAADSQRAWAARRPLDRRHHVALGDATVLAGAPATCAAAMPLSADSHLTHRGRHRRFEPRLGGEGVGAERSFLRRLGRRRGAAARRRARLP